MHDPASDLTQSRDAATADTAKRSKRLLLPVVSTSSGIVILLLVLWVGVWYWPHWQVRRSVQQAAVAHRGSVISAEVDRLGGGDEAATRVVRFLKAGRRTEQERKGAYRLLERSWSRAAIPGLVMLAEDSSFSLRDDAVELLADEYAGDVRALDVLLTTAANTERTKFARTWAVAGLARIEDERAVDGLVLALQDEDEEVRYMAMLVAPERPTAGFTKKVRALLGDKREYVRDTAAMVLESLKKPE